MITKRLEANTGIAEAAGLLRAGELVAFPTETVYGLGANALDDLAVDRLFDAKRRPSHNPVIVHVSSIEQARSLAREWPREAEALATALWPGPLTLVVPAGPQIARAVLAGGDTVGLRMPAHPVALELIAAAGIPVAAPSANRSGSISPTDAEHVLDSLDGRIAAVLDGGPCEIGIESAVVDVSSGRPQILRPGVLGASRIATLLGVPKLEDRYPREGGPLRSPGMLKRHYAPAIPLRLVEQEVLERAPAAAAVLWLTRPAPADSRGWYAGGDPSSVARQLYAMLRRAERSGAEEIWCELPPEDPDWMAVRDRLQRAAAPAGGDAEETGSEE